MSISILINVLVCVSLSFSIYLITKNLISDRFLTNEHAYVSILLSPGIYIITIAISDNWALSLGMIGALSIVRFRNPVRSSFELTLFFYLYCNWYCCKCEHSFMSLNMGCDTTRYLHS